jgi:galactonate dehydratase
MSAPARISSVATIVHERYPNLLHVLVHADDGAVGLGETFFEPALTAEWVHRRIAPLVLGQPARNAAALAYRLSSAPGEGRQPAAGVSGIETRAVSAFDIAAWDLRARSLGLPLHDALGGAVRDRIRVYNTCAGLRGDASWGLASAGDDRYDDWDASLHRPGELARELLDEGITAMKIYPFLRLREATQDGIFITPRQLEENLEPFRAIRAAVGSEIDLCVDLVNMWTFDPALRIATALEEFGLLWIEDPLRISSVRELGRLARLLRTPLAGNETLAGLPAFFDLIDRGGVSIVRVDPQWCGGVAEALRIADYANGRGLGVVFHDCAGPVAWATSVQCALHAPNAMLQEAVRAYYLLAYPGIASGIPSVVDGHVTPAPGPGHGATLVPAYVEGARVRTTTLRNGGAVTTEASP